MTQPTRVSSSVAGPASRACVLEEGGHVHPIWMLAAMLALVGVAVLLIWANVRDAALMGVPWWLALCPALPMAIAVVVLMVGVRRYR